jgi:hypothetical protein
MQSRDEMSQVEVGKPTQREWSEPRFEVIDIASETRAEVGGANDTDQTT